MIGKKLTKIEKTDKGDEGLKLTFEDGQTLEFAYSSGEGEVYENGSTLEDAVAFDEFIANAS